MKQRIEQFPGPLDPNYFTRALHDAQKGDTDSAHLLLEAFCESLWKRQQPDPAVLRYLYRAFLKILRADVPPGKALLLSKPKHRPIGDQSLRDIDLAIAVKQRLDRNTGLTPKAACLELAVDLEMDSHVNAVSSSTIERAWNKYGGAVQLLMPGELKAFSESVD